MAEHYWHALSGDEVLKRLKVDRNGLSSSEAEKRLEEYGFNEIVEQDGSELFRILFRQFSNPLILILLAAGLISLALGSLLDGLIVLAAVFINATIGFVQEYKVSDILSKLRHELKEGVTVLRDGKHHMIDVRMVVPGDILVLRQGDRVPADARVLSENGLKTNEAVLTGESMPVEKSAQAVAEDASVGDRFSMVFFGTFIEEGTGRAVVVDVASNTEVGRIAGLVVRERGRDETPLQKRFTSLARIMGIVFVGLSAGLFAIGIATGVDPLEVFLTAVAVAVAAVPESLPVALSVVLAVGARRILAKGGLVRKMSAAETLGTVTVIATDKTATLTEGRMVVARLIGPDQREAYREQFKSIGRDDGIMRFMLRQLTSTADAYIENPEAPQKEWKYRGTPIDKAVLQTAVDAELNPEEITEKRGRLAEVPFDSGRKFSAVLTEHEGSTHIAALGAPEVILGLSTRLVGETPDKTVDLTDEKRDKFSRQVADLAAEGFRVLAIAVRAAEPSDHLEADEVLDLSFLGLVIFSDPIREDVKQVISEAQKAGTRLVMVTGDHVRTAEYVAREVGILRGPRRVIEGKQLPEDAALIVGKYDVFARVSPEDKVRIVNAFKEQGHAIAMIGDGVNDAPALLRADMGVAVGSGTDVARDASDLVLLNDSFTIIVEAIAQGRILFDNIRKVTVFLLSDAFLEIVLIAVSILAGLPLALLPAHILWVNIVADVFPSLALALDRDEDDASGGGPRSSKGVLDKHTWWLVGLFAVLTSAILVTLYIFTLTHGTVEYARTMTFVGLGVASLMYVFSVRSLRYPIWRSHPFGNQALNISALIALALYGAAVHVPFFNRILETVPLALGDWGIIFAVGLSSIVAFEIGKYFFLHPEKGILRGRKQHE